MIEESGTPSSRLAFGEGARPSNGAPGSSIFSRGSHVLRVYPAPVPTVRAATHADLEALIPLWRELEAVQGPFRAYPVTEDPEGRVRASFKAAIEAKDADLLIALEGDEAVGMALIRPDHPSKMSDEVAADLGRVVVRPDRRGTGVGRALVLAAENWARDRGIRTLVATIYTANEPSREFWRAMGFELFVERLTRVVPPEEGG